MVRIEAAYEQALLFGKYIPRGERDVIRLRNPTEDKRAFRGMLTSADHLRYSKVALRAWADGKTSEHIKRYGVV